jgi:pimeloyl-ACP methyl ester carboxylesterase
VLVVRKTPDKWRELQAHNIHRVRSTSNQPRLGLISHVAAVAKHHVTDARLELLRASGVPVTICVGTRDVLIRPSNSFRLRSVLRCTLHVFEGEGHGLIQEVSEQFNTVMIEHFRAAQKGQHTPLLCWALLH